MKAAILICGAALVALTTAALAQYYVVQSPTHHCTITTAQPNDREYVTEIGPKAFNSRVAAEDRMKQSKLCSEGPFAAPASGDGYYLVQDLKTKRCTVVDKPPADTTTSTQIGTVTFKTRTEAEAGVRKEKVCATR